MTDKISADETGFQLLAPQRKRVTAAVALAINGAVFALGTDAALAQQQPDIGPDAGIEAITVTGQNLARQRAIATKRDAEVVVDAISQDDIGRLPDLNTAAALRRIPGISIQNDQGEPRFPVIRGLQSTFNRTTIDGAITPSPERGTRTVPLDIIPSSMVSRLEVYKTVTPEMDANAIGGIVNVVTKSPFEGDGEPFFSISGFLGSHENSGEGSALFGEPGDEKMPWRLSLAAGTRFGGAEQFGIVGGVDYSIRNFEIPQIEIDDADYTEFDDTLVNVGLGNGNGVVVPTNKRLFWYNNMRERIGAHGKFEWAVNDEVHLAVSGLWSKFNDDERRDEIRYELGTGSGSDSPDSLLSQTATTSTSPDAFVISGIGRFTIDREIWSSQATIDWQATEDLVWDATVIVGGGSLNNPEVTEAFQTNPGPGFTVDHGGFYPQFVPNDADFVNDLSNYHHVNRGVLDRGADEDVLEFNTNVSWDVDLFDSPAELKFGALLRNTEKQEGFTFNQYVSTVPYTLDQVSDNTLADSPFPQDGDRIPFRIDLAASDEYFQTNRNSFVRSALSISASNYDEDVSAGYVQLSFDPTDRLNIITGVRVEQTDWTGGNLGSEEPVSGSFTDVLPGLHFRYDLFEDFVLRAAYSETIGRANPSDLTMGQSVSTGTDGSISVARSNPELEARHSDNFDLSLEWYIPQGILAAGLFYKDISDNIFTITTQNATVDLGSGPQTVDTLSQPENATSATMTGYEIQYQQRLFFLPGFLENFGVSFNGTFIDGEMTIPTSTGTREIGFFQQPETILNAMGYYAVENYEIRLSYNYTDGFIDSINPDLPVKDEYWKSRETFDFQGRYNFSDQLSAVFEVVNLTDTNRTEVSGPGAGPSAGYLQESANFGRTFWLGATYSL